MKKKNEKLYLILSAVVGLAILVVAVFALTGEQKPTKTAEIPAPLVTEEPDVRIEYREVEKLVEVEKVITSQIIEESLTEMGFLVTAEYQFTDVISSSNEKTIALLFKAQSGFVASYDGVVTAGVDFSRIRVVKDDEGKTVTVTVPRAEILNVTVYHDSFVLYEEKQSRFNPFGVEDVNNALVALEENAETKAVERGILTSAQDHAEEMIRGLVNGLVADSGYTVRVLLGAK